jgi:hypothetical protein
MVIAKKNSREYHPEPGYKALVFRDASSLARGDLGFLQRFKVLRGECKRFVKTCHE